MKRKVSQSKRNESEVPKHVIRSVLSLSHSTFNPPQNNLNQNEMKEIRNLSEEMNHSFFLFEKVEPYPLALFRILWSLLMIYEATNYIASDFLEIDFLLSVFIKNLFKYLIFIFKKS